MRAAALVGLVVAGCINFDELSAGKDGGLATDLLPAHCANGIKDGDETDIDCGGSCAPCPPGRTCAVNSDCLTRCTALKCEPIASSPPYWRAVASLLVPRSGLAATLGPDGRVYAVGGKSGVAGTVVEAYSPSKNQWVTVSPLPTARAGLAAVTAADGHIYALGGSALPSVDFYTPGGGWAPGTPMMTARDNFGAASVGGLIYALGGVPAMATGEAETLSTKLWSPVKSMTIGREKFAAVAGPDGRVYVTGGDGASPYLASVEVYDPGSDSWTGVTGMQTPRSRHAAALGADGRVYVIGGESVGAMRIGAVEAYLPSADAWSPVADLAGARQYLAAAQGPDGRIYAIGGEGANSAMVEAYGPIFTASPSSGSAGTSITVNGQNFAANAIVSVYFGGGSVPLAAGATNGAGQLAQPININVPAVSPGSYPIVVRDDRSAYPVKVVFTVN